MILRSRKSLRGVALLAALSVAQVHVFAGTAASPSSDVAATTISTQAGGTLRTTNNKPIVVNGNNVRPGTTILSGSSVQTPAGVGATIRLGFAEVEMAPGADLTLDFTADSSVTVTLRRGCVILRTHGNAQGTLITPDGTSTQTGEAKQADVCFNDGAALVNQGAAANAGAGSGGVSGTGGVVGGPSTVTGLARALLIIAGAGVATSALILANRGQNPSPSTL